MEKITANRLKLRILEETLHTTGTDYEKDLKDERAHLESLLQEPPAVQQSVDYIELLGKLQKATYVSRCHLSVAHLTTCVSGFQ